MKTFNLTVNKDQFNNKNQVQYIKALMVILDCDGYDADDIVQTLRYETAQGETEVTCTTGESEITFKIVN